MSQISHVTPSFLHRRRLDEGTRRRVRYAAAALAGLTAVLYVLIATSTVSVIDAGAVADARHDQMAFATPAAIAYALGAVLLLIPRLDRRILWAVGALLQVGVIAMYFSVAPDREPSFEPWGIAIRVVQVLLLAALVMLVADDPERGGGIDPSARRLR
jgi:cell division protein FtsW (lipid II flippase)